MFIVDIMCTLCYNVAQSKKLKEDLQMQNEKIILAIETLKKSENVLSDEEIAILNFLETLKNYIPNWDVICNRHIYKECKTPHDDLQKKIKILADRFKAIREKWNYSYREMGDVCGKSHGYIAKIEKQDIKSLPKDIHAIATHLSTSVPYLIGLYDEYEVMPNILEAYFWEHPDSVYITIREKAEKLLGLQKLIRPILVEPMPFEITTKKILNLVKKDVRLADLIVKLLEAKPAKRRIYTLMLEQLLQL